MATMEKNTPPFSTSSLKDDDGWRMSEKNDAPKTSKNGTTKKSADTQLKSLVNFGKDLPAKLESQMKTSPAVALATVGGVSFVLGALLSSRIGRMAMLAGLGYAVNRAFQGEMGDEIKSFVKQQVSKEFGKA